AVHRSRGAEGKNRQRCYRVVLEAVHAPGTRPGDNVLSRSGGELVTNAIEANRGLHPSIHPCASAVGRSIDVYLAAAAEIRELRGDGSPDDKRAEAFEAVVTIARLDDRARRLRNEAGAGLNA